MTDSSPKWTPQQKLAIDTRDRDVLVTASAGTGKTAVLAGRCVDILSDTADPTDVMQMLVMTFTEASADEMRSRISDNLRTRYRKTNQPLLKQQLLMLDAAYISTIHAFCKRLITEHFHLLGIDPTVRIIDQDEQYLLKLQILEDLIEQAWQDSSLAGPLNELLTGRNIQSSGADFLKRIITLSQFLDGVVSRQNWYERAQLLSDAFKSSMDLPTEQKRLIEKRLKIIRSQYEHAIMLDQKLTEICHFSDQLQNDFITPVDKCLEYLADDNIPACAKLINNFSKPTFKRKPKELSTETADIIKAPAKKALTAFVALKNLAVINAAYEQIVGPLASVQTKVLIELIKRFDTQYAQSKKKLQCMDFADLEHLALRLFTENPTIAKSLSKRFKYIFVDEYQDVNLVQQKILESLSRSDNTFVVGDVKQSIYAFRQSRPEIFLERLKSAVDQLQTPAKPLRIDLSDNFRSRKGVLDFVNTVFSRIMTADVAGIDYDRKAYLNAGFNYEQTDDKLAELHIINDQPTDPDDDDATPGTEADFVSSSQRQAAFIANRIKKMTTGPDALKVYDKSTSQYRPAEYRDIVILMRSLSSRANEYVELLRLAEIPVTSQSSAGYFAATEITDMLSLLKVLDNPRRDIPLASTMRSPIFNISDTDLAAIRKTDTEKSTSYYDLVVKYSTHGPDKNLREKITEMLDTINAWQQTGKEGSLSDLIWHIYRATGYLSFVAALPNGKQRRANLLKLHDRAIQFEGFASSAASASVCRLVEFLEELLEQGKDWAPAAPDTSAENAVRIMSVHRSKGLEFPIVFLAELNKKFNTTDSIGDCLIDEFDALGISVIEPASKIKLSSIGQEVIAEKKTAANIAEEMRILYVAMTRARERLIMVASKKESECASAILNFAAQDDQPLKHWQLTSAKSHFDWLIASLANTPQLKKLFTQSTAKEQNLFTADLLDREQLDKKVQQILHNRQNTVIGIDNQPATEESTRLTEHIESSLTWQYPFAEKTSMRAKESVSERTHRTDEFATVDQSFIFDRKPKATQTPTAKSVSRTEIGTATHLVMQTLDLNNPIDHKSVNGTIQNLIESNQIAANIAEKINIESILNFFKSDLGQTALENPQNVLREWPFTFVPEDSNDATIVQGVVDMIINTPAGLIVIDFKTDNITPAQIEDRTTRYKPQLNLYTQAAKKILNKNPLTTNLYYLTSAIAVTIDQ